MAYDAKQYTITASAVNLTSVFGYSPAKKISSFSIIGKSGNAATFYIGKSNVTNVPANAGAPVSATLGVVWTRPPNPMTVLTTDDLYVVGTASDVAFIQVDAD